MTLARVFDAAVMVGKQRGQIADDPQAALWQRRSTLRLLEAADTAGVDIAIEPQNASSVDNIVTAAEGVEFIAGLGEHAKLMLDTFHMQIQEPQPLSAYAIAGSALRHMHFADTNRVPPGEGQIDFVPHLAALESMHYEHFVSFEISPDPDWFSAASRAIARVRTLRVCQKVCVIGVRLVDS